MYTIPLSALPRIYDACSVSAMQFLQACQLAKQAKLTAALHYLVHIMLPRSRRAQCMHLQTTAPRHAGHSDEHKLYSAPNNPYHSAALYACMPCHAVSTHACTISYIFRSSCTRGHQYSSQVIHAGARVVQSPQQRFAFFVWQRCQEWRQLPLRPCESGSQAGC